MPHRNRDSVPQQVLQTLMKKLYLLWLELFRPYLKKMQSLKAENNKLLTMADGATQPQLSPSSVPPHNTGVTSRDTWPELSDVKNLFSQVDSRVSQLGLLSESSDARDGEEDCDHAQIAGAKPKF